MTVANLETDAQSQAGVPADEAGGQTYVSPIVTLRRTDTKDPSSPNRYSISIGAEERQDYPVSNAPPHCAGDTLIHEKVPSGNGTERITAYNVQGGEAKQLISYLRDAEGKMLNAYFYLEDGMELTVGPPRSEPDSG